MKIKAKDLILGLQKIDPEADIVIYDEQYGQTFTIVKCVYLSPGTCSRPEFKLVVTTEL